MLYIAIGGSVGFAEFMFEEAAQQAGFGNFQCANAMRGSQSDEVVSYVGSNCKAQFERAKATIEVGSRFTQALGWAMPLNWWSYLAFFDAAKQSVEVQEKMFMVLHDEQVAKLMPKQSKDWTYEYRTVEYNQAKPQLLQAGIDEMVALGFHISAEYEYCPKFPGDCRVVIVWVKVVIPQ